MWMTSYINEIQKKLVTEYGFLPDPKTGLPQNVPDGKYPMTIDGMRDTVCMIDGEIHCCNFDNPIPGEPARVKTRIVTRE